MNAERMREYLLSLPHVVETEQWGGLIFWVGDKVIGGKMFSVLDIDGVRGRPISYPAGPERFYDLLETDGIIPAPYMARIFWVAVERWDVHRTASEWESELSAAHALTYAKLPPKALKVLALAKAEQRKTIAAKRKRVAAKAS